MAKSQNQTGKTAAEDTRSDAQSDVLFCLEFGDLTICYLAISLPFPMSERLAKLLKILATDPADPFVLYGIAQEHAKTGDYTEAVAFYDRTLAADPAYCYAYFHKARAQQAAGDITAALRTAVEGVKAAQKAGDAKALNELSGLQAELESQS